MTSTRHHEKTRAVDEADDHFQRANWPADPWYNESAMFCFTVPERDIGGYFYFWHRPNMNLTAAGVALWDPHGTERHNCKYFDWYNFNPLPPDADMFDFTLTNGMSCRILEPLNAYELRYQNDCCTMDLRWEGAHEVLNLHYQSGDDGDEPTAEWGAFHYEQIGRVTGTIRCDGETIDVDCHDFRDRTRGIRGPLTNMPGGGFDAAWTPSGTGFCATSVREDPTTPVSTANIDRPVHGYLIQDGEIGKIVGGRRQVVERRPDGASARVHLGLSDDRGRELHAEAEIRSYLKYHELWYVNWGMAAWQIDGEHTSGQSQDWINVTDARAHQRAIAKNS